MTGLTLIANGRDFSSRIGTYSVVKKISYTDVLTALDHTEYPFPAPSKDEITFSLLPGTEETATADYNALSAMMFQASYTSPGEEGRTVTRRVRLMTDLENRFLLLSIDGKRRYRGGDITLRVL